MLLVNYAKHTADRTMVMNYCTTRLSTLQ